MASLLVLQFMNMVATSHSSGTHEVPNIPLITQQWAGSLTMPRGIANRVPINLTVTLPQPGASIGTADTSWVYDHNNNGKQCVRHTEVGLRWTHHANGVVTAQADGEGDDFYSLHGVIDITGKQLDGNLTHAGNHGIFHLSLGAPQIASTCRAKPVPAPPPLPAPPLPTNASHTTVWPLPQHEARGSDTLQLDAHRFKLTAAPGSSHPALEAALVRYRDILFPHPTPSSASTSGLLTSLTVHVSRVSTPLTVGVDESYNLTIDRTTSVTVRANTLFGAYHALESIAQLVEFDFDSVSYRIRGVPLVIEDRPRFVWRELMVDTSRHFLPIPVLKTVVDSMLTAKLNTLHLHLVDSQAFPLVLPSAPRLSKGAYSNQEQYSLDDLQDLVKYAEARGVRVVGEVDTPGHGAAWCKGMPELCPSPPKCVQPLDVSNSKTFSTIEAVLKDLFTVLPDDFVHLGGDEVSTGCWNSTQRINKWMKANGLDADGAYGYFVTKTQAIAHSLGKQVLVWDEIWNHFGTNLDAATTIINTRFNPSQGPARPVAVPSATAHGYRVVRSENVHWYLDQTVHKPWTATYEFEPCGDIPDTSCAFILGGAASMWGETVDTSDLMQTVWPRAGAVGERLWSARHTTNVTDLATRRYVAFRCYLNRRGFIAAPALNAVAREAPPGPGSCYAQ